MHVAIERQDFERLSELKDRYESTAKRCRLVGVIIGGLLGVAAFIGYTYFISAPSPDMEEIHVMNGILEGVGAAAICQAIAWVVSVYKNEPVRLERNAILQRYGLDSRLDEIGFEGSEKKYILVPKVEFASSS